MKTKVLLLLLIIVFSATRLSFESSGKTSQQLPSYPQVTEYTFPYPNHSLSIDSRVKSPGNSNSFNVKFSARNISGLGDITVLSFDLFFHVRRITFLNITLSLNGKNANNYYFLTQFRYKQRFNFIVDEKSSLVLRDENTVKISVHAGFVQDVFSNVDYNSVQVVLQQLTLLTAFKQILNHPDLNGTNSQLTALIINPYYEILSDSVVFENTSVAHATYYTIDFIVILPKDIQEISRQTFLNLTFSYNSDLVIHRLFLENFAIVSSSGTPHSVNYLMKYTLQSTRSLTEGSLTIEPKTSGMINIHTFGQFFVNNKPVQFFPKSKEMSIVLFLTVTLVIPLILLSKLIYRRFSY